MDTLPEFFRYNRWANARVFKVCGSAETSLLGAEARGTLGTIHDTLTHMVSVEEGFAAVIAFATGRASRTGFQFLVTPTGLADDYMQHDLGWFAARCHELDGYLHELSGGLTEAELGKEARVPWLDYPATVRDGLMQVIVHSAQHRAQVFSTLGDRGVSVPGLDYVLMRAKEIKEEAKTG